MEKLKKVVLEMDLFKTDAPNLSVEGHGRGIPSLIGALSSIFTISVLAAYSVAQLASLGSFKQKTSETWLYHDKFTVDARNIRNRNKMAFLVNNFFDKDQVYFDTSKVQWYAIRVDTDNEELKTNRWIEQKIGVHACSEQDYAEFYPLADLDRELVLKYKQTGDWLCLDDLDDQGLPVNWDYSIIEGLHARQPQVFVLVYTACDPVVRTETNQNDANLCLVDDLEQDTLDAKLKEIHNYLPKAAAMQLLIN